MPARPFLPSFSTVREAHLLESLGILPRRPCSRRMGWRVFFRTAPGRSITKSHHGKGRKPSRKALSLRNSRAFFFLQLSLVSRREDKPTPGMAAGSLLSRISSPVFSLCAGWRIGFRPSHAPCQRIRVPRQRCLHGCAIGLRIEHHVSRAKNRWQILQRVPVGLLVHQRFAGSQWEFLECPCAVGRTGRSRRPHHVAAQPPPLTSGFGCQKRMAYESAEKSYIPCTASCHLPQKRSLCPQAQ
ncbi:hypothetical protein FN846DRAFT_274824 [Sphaerosporella brunnea]|uniref:Uncharacterized protein n=1 Tax=Sphaerosporella brunnea TaxID=1250544 RepID=A0A5J5EMJ0_9PEZI|nr:hypothetical protein FN846DRAFT_274824 [Sphaerosporella brunnea]